MDENIIRLGLALERKGKNNEAVMLYRKYVSISAQRDGFDVLKLFYGDCVYEAITKAEDALKYGVLAESAAAVWALIANKSVIRATVTDKVFSEFLVAFNDYHNGSCGEKRPYEFKNIYACLLNKGPLHVSGSVSVVDSSLKDIVLGVKNGRFSLVKTSSPTPRDNYLTVQ